jgi:hypothetical protein
MVGFHDVLRWSVRIGVSAGSIMSAHHAGEASGLPFPRCIAVTSMGRSCLENEVIGGVRVLRQLAVVACALFAFARIACDKVSIAAGRERVVSRGVRAPAMERVFCSFLKVLPRWRA